MARIPVARIGGTIGNGNSWGGLASIMNVRELERVLKAVIGRNPGRLALASLAYDGQANGQLAPEFVKAARTLAARQTETKGRNMLDW